MRVLVTGTSSGIGSAIAVRLAERGHEVVAGVRRLAAAPAHPRIRAVELEVTDAAQLAAVAEEVGPLGGVVNNAGITIAGPLEHLPLDRLQEQLEVNVVGVVAVTQAFLPAIRAGRGRLVMIGSAAGLVTTPFLGAYSASKFAVEAVTDALRQELTPWSLPVVMINPGSFTSQNRARTTATAEADRATMAEPAERRYGRALDAFVRFNESVEAGAGDPARVAAVVERALTARRPRTRYLVGADARMVVTMKQLLPARTVDRILSRVMGL
ncbi:SDR family NAD(P)-dependent oxidoreductase [Promicromonospora sp. CA-289599]|uniref:SDR family NAD(P)-dependent oxidoreductase n=1 Tax=Promicromonospora sp. CA-289599 TaxID=3240014 RepID=UPI003D89EDED